MKSTTQRPGVMLAGRPFKPETPSIARTVSLFPSARMFAIRAMARAESGSANGGFRAEVVFATETPVLRHGWDGPFFEVLSLQPGAVRLERLNNGAPLLDSHGAQSLKSVLGVVEGARLGKGEGTATVRFSDREEVKPIAQDVRDGIIQNVSVGYRVHKFQKSDGADGKIPTFLAVDWEPFEISLVPMGADDQAGIRQARSMEQNECEIIQGDAMPNPSNPQPTQQDRAAEIDNVLKIAGLNDDAQFRASLVESNLTLDAARVLIVDKMAANSKANDVDNHGPITITRAYEDSALNGIAGALLHRINPTRFPAEKTPAVNYLGRTLLELARMTLDMRGIPTAGLSRSKVAALALGLEGRAGMHTTSDFPGILADVANKTLRSGYQEAQGGLILVAKRVSLVDFKPVNRLQTGQAPSLSKVNEHGEFTYGTIGEERETYKLATFGRVFSITRQAIVNDDLSAFERIPAGFGQASRALERDLLAEQIISNPAMGDTIALFHNNHNNMGTGELSIDGLSLGRKTMRAQKGPDGRLIDIEPAWIVVPAALETAAEQVVSALQAAQFSDVNPFAGRLKVAVEPRLDATSLAAWYLFADPSRADTLELGLLEGQDGPYIESRVGFEVDGMEIKCRHDCAAKAIDWRSMYKSDGAPLE